MSGATEFFARLLLSGIVAAGCGHGLIYALFEPDSARDKLEAWYWGLVIRFLFLGFMLLCLSIVVTTAEGG